MCMYWTAVEMLVIDGRGMRETPGAGEKRYMCMISTADIRTPIREHCGSLLLGSEPRRESREERAGQ